jgi:uncharacterized FlaG/YvyC family protein
MIKMKRLGYITHVENCLNLDIDFDLGDEKNVALRIDTANHSMYTYIDDNDDLCTSTTYRSRLMGISNRKNKGKYTNKVISSAMNEFYDAINRSGRFVNYEIYGCDTYNRVIVKIYDPITDKCLNDIFLESRFSAAFGVYTRP